MSNEGASVFVAAEYDEFEGAVVGQVDNVARTEGVAERRDGLGPERDRVGIVGAEIERGRVVEYDLAVHAIEVEGLPNNAGREAHAAGGGAIVVSDDIVEIAVRREVRNQIGGVQGSDWNGCQESERGEQRDRTQPHGGRRMDR